VSLSRISKIKKEVTFEVRMAKGNYYKSLFDEVKCTRSYWSLIKKATEVKNRNICDIRKLDGSLTNSDKEKAEVLNEYFANVGERLAQNLLQGNQLNVYPVNKVTPTVANIEITQELVCQEISKLKPNKATAGPDNISPKLLKLAGESVVPSLTSIFKISAHTNLVPDKWKNANVTAVYKNDDEAEKENYRPISILCIPAKMETCVANTMINHLEVHNLSSNHQWAYKKSYSTELLLIKMTEIWRRALDNKQVVGIIFIDFKKAFDSVCHPILLQKLQALGISGDIWLWIKDYLQDRKMSTIVNGTKSNSCQVKFGIPQGSVLGPILFSVFCNDLPEIMQGDDGEIEIFADDTTIYVIGPNPDSVASILDR
jgi:hypothetical protein